MYLVVEYQEGFVNVPRDGHITCATVQDDYYNPVVICNTREEIIDWLTKHRPGTMNVNGDTIAIARKNWRGEPKGTDIYHIIYVELGKAIVY